MRAGCAFTLSLPLQMLNRMVHVLFGAVENANHRNASESPEEERDRLKDGEMINIVDMHT